MIGALKNLIISVFNLLSYRLKKQTPQHFKIRGKQAKNDDFTTIDNSYSCIL